MIDDRDDELLREYGRFLRRPKTRAERWREWRAIGWIVLANVSLFVTLRHWHATPWWLLLLDVVLAVATLARYDAVDWLDRRADRD